MRRTTKVNITFSGDNGVLNTVFKLFPQKDLYHLTWTRKTGFGAHFPPYLWLYWADCFQKQKGSPIVGVHRVNFMKIGSKLCLVSAVLLHIIYTSGFDGRLRCPFESPADEVLHLFWWRNFWKFIRLITSPNVNFNIQNFS